MIKSILFLFAIITFLSVKAQITIDMGDMPVVNDTIRISSSIPTPGIDVSTTGPNHFWDFSNLSPVAQRIDTFHSVASTDPLYSIFFIDNAINPNRANLATSAGDLPAAGGFSSTEAFNFYYKSASSFKQVGVAGKLNGFPTPVAFAPHDVIYNFPLNYSDMDSSSSGMTFNLPNTLYYQYTQTRVNSADGWGMLTTPYGSFQVLRVKSLVHGRDSIYLDSLGFGFAQPRPILTEYKWMGKQMDLPLLKINTQTTLATPIISLVEYRDSVRILTSIDEIINPETVNIFPNPFQNYVNIEYTLTNSSNITIELLDVQGRKVFEQKLSQQTPGTYHYILGGKGSLSQGTYFLKLSTRNSEHIMRKLVNLE